MAIVLHEVNHALRIVANVTPPNFHGISEFTEGAAELRSEMLRVVADAFEGNVRSIDYGADGICAEVLPSRPRDAKFPDLDWYEQQRAVTTERLRELFAKHK